jgi:hypothetical protein
MFAMSIGMRAKFSAHVRRMSTTWNLPLVSLLTFGGKSATPASSRNLIATRSRYLGARVEFVPFTKGSGIENSRRFIGALPVGEAAACKFPSAL